jgi:hypothetical protein
MVRMKAKYGLALLGLVIAAAAVWLLTRPAPLANMRHACPQPESGVSIVTFSGQAGEQFQFSMSSNITSGELDLSLCDQAGNVVKRMGQAKELATHFTLLEAGIYTLRMEYRDFSGDFSAAVYRDGPMG